MFNQSVSYAIEIVSRSTGNIIESNSFIDNNGGNVQAFDENGNNTWINNYWNDYFSRYPDAGITIDLSWDIAYELDGNANVTDDSARVMDHDDPVNVILSEIQQCFVELKELIDLELKHGKKVAAMAIICLSEKLLKSIIIEYVRTGSVSYYRLHLLNAYTRVIQAIAKKDSITGTCSEIHGLVGMLE